MLTLIGDCHYKIDQYKKLIENISGESLQIGDFGFGPIPEFPLQHKIFEGNHGDRKLAAGHPNYAGDWGYLPQHEVFFMGGAYSIDNPFQNRFYRRTPYFDWWPWEELNEEEFAQVEESYRAIKPRFMVTHDCPELLYPTMLVSDPKNPGRSPTDIIENRTAKFLDRLFAIHQPEAWVFGHWHFSLETIVSGTKFRCLAELETYILNT